MSTKTKTFYDDPGYSYKKYWLGRAYEDLADRTALNKLFALIPNKNSLLDIGGGFGRLTSEYVHLFKKCLLIDPSKKLSDEAKQLCEQYRNFSVKQGYIEKIPVGKEQFDVVITVRTFHHLKNLPLAIKNISQVVKPNGYFILEFANKIRFKSIVRAIFKLDFAFFTSHIPLDISRKKGTVPFSSYHHNQIETLLLSNGFTITKILSVSNFRHAFFKKIFPLNFLIKMESLFSTTSSYIPVLRYFGPSVFILAKKKT